MCLLNLCHLEQLFCKKKNCCVAKVMENDFILIDADAAMNSLLRI